MIEKEKLSKSNQFIIRLYELGFRADDYGNVINPDGTLRKLYDSSLGYKRFSFLVDGKQSSILAHRFIMFCRVGDKLFTKGLMVLHRNDNGFDNSAKNLYLGTTKDNRRDAINNNKIVKSNTYTHLHSEIYNHYLVFGQKKTVEKYKIGQKTLMHIKNKMKSGKHTTSRQISIPF